MCGRTACTLDPDGICSACSYSTGKGGSQKPVWREDPGGHQYYPSYNIAPGAYTPVMLSSSHFPGELAHICNRVIQPMRWGLVPSWYKGDPKKVSYDTNNCRAEGMLDKPTYKVPLHKGRRCVVLADGFFEWKRDNNQKQPYFIYSPRQTDSVKQEPGEEVRPLKGDSDGNSDEPRNEYVNVRIKEEIREEIQTDEKYIPNGKCEVISSSDDKTGVKGEVESTESDIGKKPLLYMAGVFDMWKSQDGDTIYSYSVITVAASPVMSWIHHRMPAILTSDDEINQWIDYGNIPISQAVKHIRPITSLQMHPVSPIVNNSRCKVPECVHPIDLKDMKSQSGKTSSSPVSKGSSQMMMKWLATGKNQQPSPEKLLSVKKSPTKLNKSQNLMMGWLNKGKRKSSEDEHDVSKKAKT